jgi:hypothetical protein
MRPSIIRFGQAFRALSSSYAPSLEAVLGLMPGIGFLFTVIVASGSPIVCVIGPRQSLEMITEGAVAVVFVAFQAMFIVAEVVLAVLGVSMGARSPDAPGLVLCREVTRAPHR